MIKRLNEDTNDQKWEEFKARCKQNPVYKQMKSMVSGSRYEIPELIYWEGSYLSFVIRPTSEGYMSDIDTSNLPTIYYDSSRGFNVEVPGCWLRDTQAIASYYDGIRRAYDVYRRISSLPLEDLEHI